MVKKTQVIEKKHFAWFIVESLVKATISETALDLNWVMVNFIGTALENLSKKNFLKHNRRIKQTVRKVLEEE